jgi:hypothetical protein
MSCTSCKSPNQEGKFCTKCGAKLFYSEPEKQKSSEPKLEPNVKVTKVNSIQKPSFDFAKLVPKLKSPITIGVGFGIIAAGFTTFYKPNNNQSPEVKGVQSISSISSNANLPIATVSNSQAILQEQQPKIEENQKNTDTDSNQQKPESTKIPPINQPIISQKTSQNQNNYQQPKPIITPQPQLQDQQATEAQKQSPEPTTTPQTQQEQPKKIEVQPPVYVKDPELIICDEGFGSYVRTTKSDCQSRVTKPFVSPGPGDPPNVKVLPTPKININRSLTEEEIRLNKCKTTKLFWNFGNLQVSASGAITAPLSTNQNSGCTN